MKNKLFLSNIILVAFLSISCRQSPISSPAIQQIKKSVDSDYTPFELDCLNYGIDVGEGWDIYPNLNGDQTFRERSDEFVDAGEVQYRTDIQHAVLRFEDTDVYSYICRIVLNPIWKTRDWGVFGIGSKWDVWHFVSVKLSAQLPPTFILGDWSPQNEPETTTTNFGISISNEGVSIDASISVVQSLDIISRTNVATNHFEIEYYYPYLDDYNYYSQVYYVMFNFIYDDANEYYLSPSVFPTIHFETKYDGLHFFHGHTRTFDFNPFQFILDLPDVPTT